MEKSEEISILEKLNSLPLSELDKAIFMKRFGIGESELLSVEEIMNIYKIDKEQVWNVERKIRRLMRHPRRSHRLKDYLEQTEKQNLSLQEQLDENIIVGKIYTEKEINEIGSSGNMVENAKIC